MLAVLAVLKSLLKHWKIYAGATAIVVVTVGALWMQHQLDATRVALAQAQLSLATITDAAKANQKAYEEMRQSLLDLKKSNEKISEGIAKANKTIDDINANYEKMSTDLDTAYSGILDGISSLPPEEQCPEAIRRATKMLQEELNK